MAAADPVTVLLERISETLAREDRERLVLELLKTEPLTASQFSKLCSAGYSPSSMPLTVVGPMFQSALPSREPQALDLNAGPFEIPLPLLQLLSLPQGLVHEFRKSFNGWWDQTSVGGSKSIADMSERDLEDCYERVRHGPSDLFYQAI